jgi:DNA-binding NarL/FixJ family response regulator
MDKIKLLIADDHQLLLDGISSLLNDEPSIIIAAKASNGFEVMSIVSQTEVDVCLLDISMPGMDGIETARILKEKNPSIKVIILTTYNDREIVEEMIGIGVSGYMLKNSTRQELLEAIFKVHSNGIYFSNEVQQSLMENYVKMNRRDKNLQVLLTQREIEVLQLLSMEYTNDKIASELNISYRTVETHRKNLMHKTKAHNLAGLLKYAYQNSIIRH